MHLSVFDIEMKNNLICLFSMNFNAINKTRKKCMSIMWGKCFVDEMKLNNFVSQIDRDYVGQKKFGIYVLRRTTLRRKYLFDHGASQR